MYQYVQAEHIFWGWVYFFEPAMLVDTGMFFLRIQQLQGCLFCWDNTIGTVIKIWGGEPVAVGEINDAGGVGPFRQTLLTNHWVEREPKDSDGKFWAARFLFKRLTFSLNQTLPKPAEHSWLVLARLCDGRQLFGHSGQSSPESPGQGKGPAADLNFQVVFPTESDFSPSNMAKNFEDPSKKIPLRNTS